MVIRSTVPGHFVEIMRVDRSKTHGEYAAHDPLGILWNEEHQVGQKEAATEVSVGHVANLIAHAWTNLHAGLFNRLAIFGFIG